ncbi:organic cation transporter protein-like [Spodoptera litura]|uniref:Organic cation transporter protein-like n=1 Tax=Spodoptera litura TaxID=69820 RepID=A0A9J7EKE5_SPOLT|nr:organic cation transporter protein-like [Spodoptera litura]
MEKEASEREPYSEFDSVLYREVGHFGKYQLLTIALLAFPSLVCAFMAGDYIFTAGSLPTRCAVPECDDPNPEYSPQWILKAVPATESGFDNCRRFANVSSDVISSDELCPVALFDRDIIVPCDAYVYERTNTIVYDFNIECQEWLRALPGTLNSAGGMVALVLAGFISDRLGRRMSIVFFSFNIALVGVIRAFSVNFAMYTALQFMQTAIGGGAFSAAYILAAEIVGPGYRVRTSATISSMFALGQVVLGILAFAIPAWKTLTLVLYIPVFLIISYYWILSESFRWLLSKNKQEEGKATLEYAARLNKKQISDKNMNFLLTAIQNQIEENKEVNQENLFYRVIKSPIILRRCCTTPIMWMTTVFIYYGLSINSVNLTGNMYLNYIATAAIEIPGYWTAVLVLDRVGRRPTLFCGFMICAICCLAFAFIPKSMYTLSLILYLIGKYCIGLVMTSLYLYTAELYPTRYRHSFLGFSSMLGRIGSIVAPLTPALMIYWSGIPSVMFAGTAFLSAILVLTQPETRGQKVPDTIEDAERLGKTK